MEPRLDGWPMGYGLMAGRARFEKVESEGSFWMEAFQWQRKERKKEKKGVIRLATVHRIEHKKEES